MTHKALYIAENRLRHYLDTHRADLTSLEAFHVNTALQSLHDRADDAHHQDEQDRLSDEGNPHHIG